MSEYFYTMAQTKVNRLQKSTRLKKFMKNIAENLKKLKTGKAKTLFLTGLIGLLPSCKKDTWQDFEARNQNPGHSNDVPAFTNYEPFMGHMQNVRDAVFYLPGQDKDQVLFGTNIMGEVSGCTNFRDVQDKDYEIWGPVNVSRIENTTIDGNSAKFMAPVEYTYCVEYHTPYGSGKWRILNASEEYRNMTNQELADLAYSRIMVKSNGQAEYHAQQIRDAILNGQGGWNREESFYLKFNSNGWTQNLKNSDFGTFDLIELDNSNVESDVYSGGLPGKEIQKSAVQPQTFRATAYGSIKYEDNGDDSEHWMMVSTGRDSATFTIDAMQNETIVMPFQNWYTVTIVRTNNSVVSQFENTSAVSTPWQIPHLNIQETGYREGLQDNGLYAKDGLFGNEGDSERFITGTAVNYYTDETGYVEFVGQGYRKDWSLEFSLNRTFEFTFSFGGTNRPRTDEPTTGIEEIHYKVSKRNNFTPYQKQK